ncbi:dynamin family protein [Candidatus Albibeggiatoa sp. nov. NOAA]|uniref:dynamin family protein n=1 Tax=Candidatus Albibeggiatoa sp. nov. NOAA TaxID=3162724 RepID=UPI003300D686|nr:dynamin family protein [Thiotrichaceae bacterium]
MADTHVSKRIKELETHLKEENDILYDVIKIFRELDSVAYQLGIIDNEQSYATNVSWWPMVSIMGTFSAGKSTFINSYINNDIQRTGNQAVDDKFTVISYSDEEGVNTLPGIALDADPRFPFYQFSRAISDTEGGDHRLDGYMQLKTCNCDALKGKILIDSPGFDADHQRTATLRITKHILDLSDLVLVFFDARHPEPGAMHDTLQHLVTETKDRPDANKFMYILNQIDITAREDNLEEVVAAWQRSLAQAGLTAGRFYRIYNPEVSVPIENPVVRERMEAKAKEDIDAIQERMDQVSIERAYRIVGILEHSAKEIEHEVVPQLQELIARWRSSTFWTDLSIILLAAIGGGAWWYYTGMTMDQVPQDETTLYWAGGVAAAVLLFIHMTVSSMLSNSMLKNLRYEVGNDRILKMLSGAFRQNTCFMRRLFMPLFSSKPSGWHDTTRRQVHKVLADVNLYVRRLNDRFTNPSGKKETEEA